MSNEQPNDVSIPTVPGETGTLQEVEMSQEEFSAMLFNNMVKEVAEALGMYTALGVEVRTAHAHAAVQEQFQIMEKVIPTMVDSDSIRNYPTLILAIKGPTGVQGQVAASKSMAGQDDPGQALYSAFMLALLSTPIARALLRINGFEFTFSQAKQPIQQKNKIIV